MKLSIDFVTKRSMVVTLAGVLLLGEALVLGARLVHSSAPYDDAFITLRYARNFAEGRGFVYNPAEGGLGTSSPFYGMVLGSLSRVTGADPLWLANWFSAFALAVAGWYTFRLVLEDFGLFAAAVAGASVAINPMLVSVWGGEWLVAIAAMAAGFYYYRVDRLTAASVALSLAVLLRGEAVFGAAIVLVHASLTGRHGVLRALAVSAALGVIWAGTAWVVIGHVMPTTLATKQLHGRSGMFFTYLAGFDLVGRQMIRADKQMLALAVLAWHGALFAALKRGVSLLIGLWVVTHVAFYAWMHLPFYHWYIAPVVFGLSVAAGIGVAAIVAYTSLVVPNRAAARAISVAVALLLSAAMLAAEARSTRAWIRAKPDPREALSNSVGTWLAGHSAGDASVAYVEIGRIGYYSRRRIVDPMGLITPGAAQKVADRDFGWAVYRYKPDYYIVNSGIPWADMVSSEPWFQAVYRPVTSLTSPDGSMTATLYQKQPGAVVPDPPNVESLQIQDGAVVGEIVGNTAHSQTFQAGRPRLTAVSTRLATFARVNHGTMRFTLEQLDPPRFVHEEDFEMADVTDNAWRTFRFPPIDDSRGKRFKFTLRPMMASPGNAITIWYSASDTYAAGEHLVDGQPAAGDLTVKLLYDSPAPDPAH